MTPSGIAPPSRAAPTIVVAALVGAGASVWAAQDALVRHEARTLDRAQEAALVLLAREAERALSSRAPAAVKDGTKATDAGMAKPEGRTADPVPARRTIRERKDSRKGKRGRTKRRRRRSGPDPLSAADAPPRVPEPDRRVPTIHDRMQAFLADHPTLDGIRVRTPEGGLAFAGTFPEGAYRREAGPVEVAARDPAGLRAEASLLAVDERLAAASVFSVFLMGFVGVRLRRRLVQLAEVAHGVAAGRFTDLPRLSGRDEFQWIADTLRDTADLVREQIEKVHGRNAHLVRDLVLQGDHLARLTRCAALLVSPVTGDDGCSAAFEALAEDTDAAVAVLFEQTDEGTLVPRAARGIDPARVGEDGAWVVARLQAAAPDGAPEVLPPWTSDHPWMRACGRSVPLEGVVAVPLDHQDRREGLLLLAARHRLPDRELAFLADVARPFAIAMANRRAYHTQRALARTLAERNDALLRQRDELEAVDRLRKQFVANMSHELRTPLGAVIGYAELLLDELYGPIAPEQREALEGILETASHLLGLVNQVLDLSKAEHEITPEPKPCDLRAAAEEAARMCSHLARDRPYDIEVTGEPTAPITTDPEYVRQILLNLVGNAVKFTREGHVRLCVERTGDGGACVRVVDTGPGIAPDHLELVFEPFRQVDGSSTRAADGAGLGLAISRRIARRLGGDVTVTSTPGKGSVFTLRLPKTPPSAESDLQLAQEAA